MEIWKMFYYSNTHRERKKERHTGQLYNKYSKWNWVLAQTHDIIGALYLKGCLWKKNYYKCATIFDS